MRLNHLNLTVTDVGAATSGPPDASTEAGPST